MKDDNMTRNGRWARSWFVLYACLLCILPSAGIQAQGHGEVLFESPQGFWLAPSKWSGVLYGPTMRNANWHFT